MITMLRLRRYRSSWLLSLLLITPFQLSATELETVPVVSADVPRVYQLDGVIEAVRKTTMSAQISSEVEAVYFDVDDYVEKGEVIVRLNNKQPTERLKQAEAEKKKESV